MTPTGLVRSSVLAAAACLLLGGCTLYRVHGQDAVPYDRVTHLLTDVTPEEARQRVEELEAAPDAGERPAAGVRTVFRDSGFPWPLLFGTWTQEAAFRPEPFDETAQRTLVSKDRVGGLLGFILYRHRITSFDDVETGRRVSSTREGGLPLLYRRMTHAAPAGFLTAPDPRLLDKRFPLEAAPYHYETSTDLVMGVLGWGERNGTAFLKIAFFEIPLWTDDEPDSGE